mgnify:FL=1
MDILADKVQYLFENRASNDEIVNFIKNYPVIINESNLGNDFVEAVETILKRSLTEDELEKISDDGCVEEIVENMLDEIGNYAHHYINQNGLK